MEDNLKSLFPPDLKEERLEDTGFNKMGQEDRIRVLSVFRALAVMAQDLPGQTVTGASLFLMYLSDLGTEEDRVEESTAEQENTYVHNAPENLQ